jgi:hypothetical protein
MTPLYTATTFKVRSTGCACVLNACAELGWDSMPPREGDNEQPIHQPSGSEGGDDPATSANKPKTRRQKGMAVDAKEWGLFVSCTPTPHIYDVHVSGATTPV